MENIFTAKASGSAKGDAGAILAGSASVFLFPEGKAPKIHVSFHADDSGDPARIFSIDDVDRAKQLTCAKQLAEGILLESRSVYCARIWEGPIPVQTIYRAAGILFNFNALGILSREKAEAAALEGA